MDEIEKRREIHRRARELCSRDIVGEIAERHEHSRIAQRPALTRADKMLVEMGFDVDANDAMIERARFEREQREADHAQQQQERQHQLTDAMMTRLIDQRVAAATVELRAELRAELRDDLAELARSVETAVGDIISEVADALDEKITALTLRIVDLEVVGTVQRAAAVDSNVMPLVRKGNTDAA